MRNFRLYLILDRGILNGRDLVDAAKQAVAGGVDLIQYRDKVSSEDEITKTAEKIVCLDCPVIINDYPDIAAEVGAFGVHVGQTDCAVKYARDIYPGAVVGVSAENTAHALKAASDGADYIGAGPVFPTNTKTDTPIAGLNALRGIIAATDIPVFAIGGISLDNIDTVLDAGARAVAVAGAILLSDNIEQAARMFAEKLRRNG